jgi:hypothetical protein
LTRTTLILPVLALMLALTMAGCTTMPAAPEAAVTTAPAPTPSPTPTPEVLTTQTAGARYLSAVCGSNKEDREFGEASRVPNQPIAVMNTAAAEGRDATRAAAQILDDPMFVWPASVADDVALVRDSMLAGAGTYDSLAAAPSLDVLNTISFADDSTSGEAAQRIRLRLNLPADTSAGCEQFTQ